MRARTTAIRLAAAALCLLGLFAGAPAAARDTNGIVVYETDFGLKDGAVSAMRGVALSVDPTLRLEDLTHEIPAFNIWEGAYRLNATAPYWPPGTVFVSVIDPGVGTERKSVVLKTKSGHYFVSPDNGTLTLVAERLGIEAVRESTRAASAGRAPTSPTPSTAATCTAMRRPTSPRARPASSRSARRCRPRS